jgi:dTDP-4-amino-4,6-dideoxygalactose transaminase
MTADIKQVDPLADYLEARDEIDGAVATALASGWYVLGQQVRDFEAEMAGDLGVAHVVGAGNGTDALVLCLRALGIGPGDSVLTVSHTAVATVAAIELVGAEAVLVDIEAGGFNLDPEALRQTILALGGKRRLKAVVAVHLYGCPLNLEAVTGLCQEFELALIEDCAQAQGARYRGQQVGSFGDMAAFSFYPTKNLGALGDGGAVACNDDGLALAAREIAQYGWRERFISEQAGLNSRLDELQAAILRVKLQRLHANNQRRRDIASQYTAALAGLEGLQTPAVPEACEHVYHQYVLVLDEKDALAAHLKAAGIGTGVHYPQPVHVQPAYLGRVALGAGGLPNTEALRGRILSLPMYPQLSAAEVARICEAVQDWHRQTQR